MSDIAHDLLHASLGEAEAVMPDDVVPLAAAAAPDDFLARRPRTFRAFSEDEMRKLHALYYDRAVPISKVAAAFGVPVSTLLRWIGEMDWPRRRSAAREIGVASDAPPAAPDEDETAREAPDADSPLALDLLREDIRQLARRELGALRRVRGEALSLADRERRVRILASLNRLIDRVDNNLDASAQAHAISVIETLLREGARANDTLMLLMRAQTKDLLRLMRARAQALLDKANNGRPFGRAAVGHA